MLFVRTSIWDNQKRMPFISEGKVSNKSHNAAATLQLNVTQDQNRRWIVRIPYTWKWSLYIRSINLYELKWARGNWGCALREHLTCGYAIKNFCMPWVQLPFICCAWYWLHPDKGQTLQTNSDLIKKSSIALPILQQSTWWKFLQSHWGQAYRSRK